MITVEHAQTLLARVAPPKPHSLSTTKLYLSPDTAVRFSMRVRNSYDPHNPQLLTLELLEALPPHVVEPDQFYDWCLANVMWLDLHECQEWFKVDGHAWRDPHHQLLTTNVPDVAEIYAAIRRRYRCAS